VHALDSSTDEKERGVARGVRSVPVVKGKEEVAAAESGRMRASSMDEVDDTMPSAHEARNSIADGRRKLESRLPDPPLTRHGTANGPTRGLQLR
jgi:hypothetical protein